MRMDGFLLAIETSKSEFLKVFFLHQFILEMFVCKQAVQTQQIISVSKINIFHSIDRASRLTIKTYIKLILIHAYLCSLSRLMTKVQIPSFSMNIQELNA